MRSLEYTCDACGVEVERLESVHDPVEDVFPCRACDTGRMQWTPTVVPLGHFAYTPGKETGVYENDYGKRATWDLTPKGKYQRLIKDGVVSDPFAEHTADVKAGKVAPYASPDTL